MYFKIMSPICYGIIGYLLNQSGVTHETWVFWGILIMIIVIQLITAVEAKEHFTKE
jgi:surface polysaccharide O-acyltransferase-like enzyme